PSEPAWATRASPIARKGMISVRALSRVELEGGFAHSVSFRVPRSAPWHSSMRSFERRGEPLAASHVADRRRGCTKLIAPFEPRKERTDANGLLLERHQNDGRSVRARATRHLLRRKTDRASAARDDR